MPEIAPLSCMAHPQNLPVNLLALLKTPKDGNKQRSARCAVDKVILLNNVVITGLLIAFDPNTPFQCVWPLLHIGTRGEFGGGRFEETIKAYSVLTVPHAKDLFWL